MSSKEDNKESRKINTGGGAYIGGTVSTSGGDFVGRDKIVTANRGSIAIGGNVSGSTIITGDGNIIGDRNIIGSDYLIHELKELLDKLQSELETSQIANDELEEIKDDLEKVMSQLEKSEPNKRIILKRLDSLSIFFESFSEVQSMTNAIQIIHRALTLADRLFV